MSKFLVRSPVLHIPTFAEYEIMVGDLANLLLGIGLEIPFPYSDNKYFYTDANGWAKVIPHLVLKSDLYKPEKFDCEDYAMKAQVACAELFGLNALRYVYGDSPQGRHGYCIFWDGVVFTLFEPNEGFSGGSVFPVGENGYIPLKVLL